MKLKEKTYKKFVDFFAETAARNQNTPFEVAYAEIQRGTGAASITMKKALQVLVSDGIIETKPGRNSRYVQVTYQQTPLEPKPADEDANAQKTDALAELLRTTDQLRQRLRVLEILSANLQERLAVLEEAK
ncbi:MAG: IclR family transcriptional regulator [Gracilibacteraceae bacterium]|nr:IclR family transcriptional regulator [Gracilibacteraceae bacterium]